MAEQEFRKLQFQVMGLERVVQTMLAMQYSMKAKEEADFAKAVGQVEALKEGMITAARAAFDPAPPSATKDFAVEETVAAIARCCDGARQQLALVAAAVLDVQMAASDAKN